MAILRGFCIILLCVIFGGYRLTGQPPNGDIDAITDFAQKTTVSIPMPDGVSLMADVYLPVFMDSLSIPFPLPGIGEVQISLLERGNQYIIYDSINGQPNPNPYELPTLFVRTPYNKNTENIGHIMAFLGYSVVIQDNRGTYASEGNYLPMFSDSWAKAPYHPDFVHSLDQFEPENPNNANSHADGVHSLNYILNKLKRIYEGDSIMVSNGSVGMIGASALGNVQYQLASAEKLNPLEPGLKGLFPIVATNEHYKSTAVQNGVFREALVTNWITQQYKDVLDENDPETFHRTQDFGLTNVDEVARTAINYWLVENNGGKASGYYPNSPIRSELDASFAPVDEFGKGKSNGAFSRYSNMEIPMYHLTGWWDIFINGQIETFNKLRNNLDPELGNDAKQKLVIGPWAHQTITEFTTGDVTYPKNVNDFLVDLQNFDFDNDVLPLGTLFSSEVFSWFRYTLNQNDFKKVGNPKVLIKASSKWQALSPGLEVQMPSKDYIIPYNDFINYLGGKGDLKSFPYKLRQLSFEFENSLDIPSPSKPFIELDQRIQADSKIDMETLPAVRLYIASAVIGQAGNYWMETDSFPFLNNISRKSLYLHADYSMRLDNAAVADSLLYVHDPDDPVRTVGGANMTVKTPQYDRASQGQINLADPMNKTSTMDRSDVLQFTSAPLQDSVTVIGIPDVSFYASSTPLGGETDSTDTDFFARILEVLPTGEELYVVGGAVNARARLYAAQMVQGEEDSNIPFQNIRSAEIYRYHFNCLPMGYTFQKGSRMKVLISSSNYPRFQSNPNIPLKNGEFFLRKPKEDISYMYNGIQLKARKASQLLMVGGQYPASINLPVYRGNIAFGGEVTHMERVELSPLRVYPNPASDELAVFTAFKNATLEIYKVTGAKIWQQVIPQNATINVANWDTGVYILKAIEKGGKRISLTKLVIQN